jgi:hypothetical protein
MVFRKVSLKKKEDFRFITFLVRMKKSFFELKMLAEFFLMSLKNLKNNCNYTFDKQLNENKKDKKMHAETFLAS